MQYKKKFLGKNVDLHPLRLISGYATGSKDYLFIWLNSYSYPFKLQDRDSLVNQGGNSYLHLKNWSTPNEPMPDNNINQRF